MKESRLQKAVVVAWNSLVGQRAEKLPEWERLAATGNALERYRSRLLIAVTADGPIRSEIPELTRLFLEEIVVEGPADMTVRFLDGTEMRVKTG